MAEDVLDADLVEPLRAGDEAAFVALVSRYHAALVRLALVYVRSRAVAEEVAQETWLGVLRGLDRFQGRSTLKTWIFHILVNQAKTRARREGRSIPFSALQEHETPAVEPSRFLTADHRWAGHWASPPPSWDGVPEERLLSQETRAVLEQGIRALSPYQQAVIVLRDVESCPAAEVCNILGISETNQRVLLHRARSRVRRALAAYLTGE